MDSPVSGSGENLGHSSFPIVGIGASAGGFEAFRQLLDHLPDSTGMALLFVQHLDPHHESQLSELLARATRMPVDQAVHGTTVEPDHVYVIPPNANLAIVKGVLQVSPRPVSRGPHLAIDHLFRSLADDQQARAIGVVLSGTGSDGTLGLGAIKAVGGITLAQEPRSAAQPGMPKSAIDSGYVDFVAPLEQIARRLVEMAAHPYHQEPSAASMDALEERSDQLDRILRTVRLGTGVDFREYRKTTLRRRILRRMALHGEASHEDYIRRLEADGTEVETLYRDLLINVTSFFRDPELFESLKRNVFPAIVDERSGRSPIRIWVAGCSTGQEAYSLAMALWEFLDTQPRRPPVQIFATDLSDRASLDRARAGVYPESIEAEVSPERLRRFFTRENNSYRISKDLRDACVFARQNLTADPPFSHVQLISCRNVLIYMSAALQKRVLPVFHYALDNPGFLVLGTAESVGGNTDLFDPVDRDHKIFAKKATTSRVPLRFSRMEREGASNEDAAPPATATPDLQREADRATLRRYAPAGVLVNESFDVVQFRGHTSPFLTAPPGEPTTNVLRMAREGLLTELRNALIEAKTRWEPVQRKAVRVRGEERFREIDLLVVPIQAAEARAGCLLILFEEADGGSHAPSHAQRVAVRTSPHQRLWRWLTGSSTSAAESAGDDHEVAALRQELSVTREYLESLVQQQDAANEELRSSNEEVQSSNEELQSTNEELETAKEELQSSNEELSTVNEQLQSRNVELNLVNDDLANLQNSTTIPIIVLGCDLRIRRFTQAAKRILNLVAGDLGRPISDLAAAIAIPDLEHLVAQVVETIQPIEREVRDARGRWYDLRVHPYRTADNRIDGAVVVFVDIDAIKSAEEVVRESRDYAEAIVDTVHEPVLVLDADLRVRTANRSFCDTFGAPRAETEGRLLYELGNGQWDIPELRRLLNHVLPGHEEIRDFAMTHAFPLIGTRTMMLNARTLSDAGPSQILLSIRDITASQRAADALRASDRQKDQFLAVLAHELRNPLGAMLNSLEVMKRIEGVAEPVARARALLERPLRLTMRLVDDLLDLSRIVENKLELRMERVPLASVVDVAIENTRAQMSESGHTLAVALPEEPVWLEADPVRLAQAIGNLLSNAARFTPAHGRIELACTSDEAARQIEISVRDNGVGIAPDEIGPIFGMFQQGSPVSGSRTGGLGVGLALTKQLVELHDGTIEAKSAGTGRGSEFIVRLPAAGPPGLQIRVQSRPHRVASHRRVLLVDDDADQAESMKLLLERLGHTVRVVHDGTSALAAALEFGPDLALVDIGLPDIDGHTVARRLRQHPDLRQLRLVAQTGWGGEEDRRRSADAGFEQHLVKPVEIEDLQRLFEVP